MAELALKVGSHEDPTGYQDGDIVCAFNRRRIRCVHAEHICDVRKVAFNRDGLNPLASLPRHFYELTHQFKFERVSSREVRRTDLWTLEEEVYSNTPNAQGHAIDVAAYLRRQADHPGHAIFGVAGAEVWYGGRKDKSHARLDLVWAKIEELSANLEANHTLWPMGTEEAKRFAFLPVDDFVDPVQVDYETPLFEVVEEEGRLRQRVLRRRRFDVPFRDLLSAKQVEDLDDSAKAVDLRGEVQPLARQTAVRPKAEPAFDFVRFEGGDLTTKSGIAVGVVLASRALNLEVAVDA